MKACFSNKKYPIAIQICPTQIGNSLLIIEKPGFNRFLKIIGVQYQLLITFCSDLVCIKRLKAKNSCVFLLYISLLHIKSEQNVIRKYYL